MKKFITALLLTTVATATVEAASPSSRQIHQEKRLSALERTGNRAFISKENHTLEIQKTQKAKASTVKVDFVNTMPDDYTLNMAVGIDTPTGAVMYYADSSDFGETSLPKGNYNFLFWASSEEEPYYYCLLCEENIDVKEDMTFEVDFSKCTNMVDFQAYLPDGQRAMRPLVNYDTDETIEEGNLSFGLWTLFVFLNGTLIDFPSGGLDRGVFDDGWSFSDEEGGNVLVNPDVNALSLVQYRQMIGDDTNKGTFYTSITASPARGGTYHNAPSDYAYFDCPMSMTEAGEAVDEIYPALYVNTTYFTQTIMETGWSNEFGEWPYSSSYWVGDDTAASDLGIDFYPSPCAVGAMGYQFSNSDDSKLGIISNPLYNDCGTGIYLAVPNTFNSISSLNTYNSYTISDDGKRWWEENAWLSYYCSQKLITDGNTVPVLVTEPLWYTSDETDTRSILYHSYKGRNGEVKTIDLIGETTEVKINGEEQNLAPYSTLSSFTRAMSGKRFGEWDIDITDNNCLAFGEKGLNRTHIHFNDKCDDVCAPTVQMLQTADREGNITDTFASSADGRMYIYGGDFTPHYNARANREYFTVSKCAVAVEYAISGSDEWTELECHETKERFLMPGWGYCWKVDMSAISNPGADTTYDLRVTLSDDAGNYQKQILTPVFKILGTTGVRNVSTAMPSTLYFNLQGQRITNPSVGNICIEKSADGSVRKIIITE